MHVFRRFRACHVRLADAGFLITGIEEQKFKSSLSRVPQGSPCVHAVELHSACELRGEFRRRTASFLIITLTST
jgi:hypothetical protein